MMQTRVGFTGLGSNLGMDRKMCLDKQNNHKTGQRIVTKAFKGHQAPRDLVYVHIAGRERMRKKALARRR
jgi:hypothetical protein